MHREPYNFREHNNNIPQLEFAALIEEMCSDTTKKYANLDLTQLWKLAFGIAPRTALVKLCTENDLDARRVFRAHVKQTTAHYLCQLRD